MKKLVIAEKPSVGKEIAKILSCSQMKNGYIEGTEYVITWALGHLVTLCLPEEIKEEWRLWQESTLPMIPDKFKTKVIPQTSKQFQTVKSLLCRNDISEIIIATDAGREGELVARWIIEKAHIKKPLKRLWISSLTQKAIKDGFNNLQPAAKYDSLYLAALGRAKADWLIGLNVTRALTVKYQSSLSAGRVQTPTLSIIVDREKEINKFVSKKYYTLKLSCNNETFNYMSNNSIIQYSSKETAQEELNKLKSSKLTIDKVTNSKKTELPPLLYDLTSLQEDANRIYGFKAKYTLDLIQKLYESYKYLTYPRTDSKHLTKDMYSSIKERLRNSSYGVFKAPAIKLVNGNIKNTSRIFNDSLVSDHHAIIPTEEKVEISFLNDDEKRIFDLVLKRFIQVFMDDYTYNHQTVIIKSNINNNYFQASFNTPISLGFKELSNDLDKKQIKTFKEQDTVIPNISINEGNTKPKERYTEGMLLEAMENAGRFVEDKQEKETLKQSSGIGTPATRAEIIERLFDAGYIKLNGKSISPTPKGIQLIDLVPLELKSPSLSAYQESNLTKIYQRKLSLDDFINEIVQLSTKLTKEVLGSTNKFKHDNVTTSKCPQCGKQLLDVTNKFGKSLVCVDKECGYKKVVYKNSKLRCPTCHKTMKLYSTVNGNVFNCECGFKAKEEKFFEMIKSNKSGINKRETQKFLNNQEKEIPKNNPFKDFFDK